MEKQDVVFSKSIVEIRSRKSKSEFLMFAKLSAEKGSSDNCHAFEKAKRKSTEEMELA